MKIATSLNFAARSREGALELKESLSLIKNAAFCAVEVDLSRGIGAAALDSDFWEEKITEIKELADAEGLRIRDGSRPRNWRLLVHRRCNSALLPVEGARAAQRQAG